MVKEAVILAGGFGTRLKNVIDDIPKSMARIGNVPFLSFLLDHLFKHKMEKIVLAIGYKYETIISYFGDNYKDMKLIYSVENKPLDTGGAILKAIRSISSDTCFVLNGDTYFDVDLSVFEKLFNKSKPVLSVALKPMANFDRYGSVTTSEDRIICFNEKKYCESGLINGGVYILRKEWLINKAPGEVFSFEKDMMEKRVGKDVFTSYISDTYFVDIGIPEDYTRASKDLGVV